MAVSPWVSDLLSVVIVRVTLHEVSPMAIAIAVVTASAMYLMVLTSRCFCASVNGFIITNFVYCFRSKNSKGSNCFLTIL